MSKASPLNARDDAAASMNYRMMIALVSLGLLLVAGTAMYLSRWAKPQGFQGDGVFMDKGPGATRPRYTVRFAEISTRAPGEYTFSFSGVPSEAYTFSLELSDLQKKNQEVTEFYRIHPNGAFPVDLATVEKREELKKDLAKNATGAEVIIKSDAHVMCSAGSPLNGWVLG